MPLKSLKRWSSLSLRAALALGAGRCASFAFPVRASCCSFTPSLLASAVSRVCLSSNVCRHVPTSIVTIPPSWLALAAFRFLHRLRKLAGRLGFEPRQVPPKGTVLPLDDRPTGCWRREDDAASSFSRNSSNSSTSCANTAREARSRCAAPQCRGSEDALPLDLPLLCSDTARTGPNPSLKAPHQEPHPRSGRRPRAHAQCLQERDTAQKRPLQSRLQSGADKREKRSLGQVSLRGHIIFRSNKTRRHAPGDTGGVRLAPRCRDRPTQHVKSIG